MVCTSQRFRPILPFTFRSFVPCPYDGCFGNPRGRMRPGPRWLRVSRWEGWLRGACGWTRRARRARTCRAPCSTPCCSSPFVSPKTWTLGWEALCQVCESTRLGLFVHLRWKIVPVVACQREEWQAYHLHCFPQCPIEGWLRAAGSNACFPPQARCETANLRVHDVQHDSIERRLVLTRNPALGHFLWIGL